MEDAFKQTASTGSIKKTIALFSLIPLVFCVFISAMVCFSEYPLLTVGTLFNQQCGIKDCRVGINLKSILSGSTTTPAQVQDEPANPMSMNVVLGALTIVGIQNTDIKGKHGQSLLEWLSYISFGFYLLAFVSLVVYGLVMHGERWFFWSTMIVIGFALVINCWSCISFAVLKDKIFANDVNHEIFENQSMAGSFEDLFVTGPGLTEPGVTEPGPTDDANHQKELSKLIDEDKTTWELMFYLYLFAILAAAIVFGANALAFLKSS